MEPPGIEIVISGIGIPRHPSNPSSWRWDEGLGETRMGNHWSTIPGWGDSPGVTSGCPPDVQVSHLPSNHWDPWILVWPPLEIPGFHGVLMIPDVEKHLTRYEKHYEREKST